MKIIRGRAPGARAEQREATFTGKVWGDPVMAETDGVTINTVFFAPGARTHWHSHGGGQVLHVTAGAGWVGLHGQPATHVRVGDVVWTPPGEEHWHGAASNAFMAHLAVSIGPADWQSQVTDDDYPAAEAPADPLHTAE